MGTGASALAADLDLDGQPDLLGLPWSSSTPIPDGPATMANASPRRPCPSSLRRLGTPEAKGRRTGRLDRRRAPRPRFDRRRRSSPSSTQPRQRPPLAVTSPRRTMGNVGPAQNQSPRYRCPGLDSRTGLNSVTITYARDRTGPSPSSRSPWVLGESTSAPVLRYPLAGWRQPIGDERAGRPI